MMDKLISQQAAIEAVEFGITYAKAIDTKTGEVRELFKESNEELRKAVERIKALPSAQPEHKVGRWIQLTCDSAEWWYCSKCNGRAQMNPWAKYNYCPNCGADMRGKEHE